MLYLPTDVTTEWHQSDDRPQYQDPAFYRNGDIVSLTNRDGLTAHITAAGDRRAEITNGDGSITEIATREEFRAAFVNDSAMPADLEWLNNPWFTVHLSSEQESEEDVSYTLDEALDHALNLLGTSPA